jgi:hypothetical protein
MLLLIHPPIALITDTHLQATPQIRNPNFKINPPQIRQRDPRDQWEQRGPDQ